MHCEIATFVKRKPDTCKVNCVAKGLYRHPYCDERCHLQGGNLAMFIQALFRAYSISMFVQTPWELHASFSYKDSSNDTDSQATQRTTTHSKNAGHPTGKCRQVVIFDQLSWPEGDSKG